MPVAVVYLEQDANHPQPEWIGLFRDQAAALAHTHALVEAGMRYKRACDEHVSERTRRTTEYLLRNRHAIRWDPRFKHEPDPQMAKVDYYASEIGWYLDDDCLNCVGDPEGEVGKHLHLDQIREPLPRFSAPKWEDYKDDQPRREGCNFYYFPCEQRE